MLYESVTDLPIISEASSTLICIKSSSEQTNPRCVDGVGGSDLHRSVSSYLLVLEHRVPLAANYTTYKDHKIPCRCLLEKSFF